ncbi:Hsp70 family protein [Kibdelosporangium philippinense]|uniref:Hsp70 family protein n=1 Tax=Kibdelosporangium philippinense TaxID=211113 RepID=A0ABS8ZW27_9PSEU|nr:Hsp70 family protein [Kibdelosporangium philippinense]MCE7011903.1 Hsp70 family protein [Kibdelosporangium philippinense]
MPYVLGIDVGTCRTAAALCRYNGSAGGRQNGSTWGDPESVQLGERTATAPTVVYFAADGTVVVGDAADRNAASDPANAARDFARRIGDEVPLMVGREVCTAETLAAVLITWTVNEVSTAEGEPPEHVVVTHPAGWGNHRRRLLHRALRQTNLDNVTLLPEPVAISENHAATEDVQPGDALGVYDLGATGLAIAVVRRSQIGTFDVLNSAESVDSNGGYSFDDVVFEYVRNRSGGIDPADPDAWTKLGRMRQECVAAKEFLSASTEATVREAVLTRAEFEEMIRTSVQAGIEELLRIIGQATEVKTVVVTGGSARIPLVSELVKAEVPGRTVIAAEPELACARGAAIVASRLAPAPQAPPPAVISAEDAPPAPPRPDIEITPLELPAPRKAMRALTGRPKLIGGVSALVLAAGVGLTFYMRGEDPPKPQNPASSVVAPVNNSKPTPLSSPVVTPTPPSTQPSASSSSSSKKPTATKSSTAPKTGEDGR